MCPQSVSWSPCCFSLHCTGVERIHTCTWTCDAHAHSFALRLPFFFHSERARLCHVEAACFHLLRCHRTSVDGSGDSTILNQKVRVSSVLGVPLRASRRRALDQTVYHCWPLRFVSSHFVCVCVLLPSIFFCLLLPMHGVCVCVYVWDVMFCTSNQALSPTVLSPVGE